MSKKKEEPFTIAWTTDLPYRYSMGRVASKFFKELKEKGRMLGIKCSECGRVYFPPRAICPDCFVEMTEFVELSGEGTLAGFTVVNYPFVDPNTGETRPFPYGYGAIKLDGTDTYMLHFVDETDPEKVRSGIRVKAVFRDKREGNLSDIPYFKIIEE
ncbi:MAG: Zn-ribbon domain-containing OB-fold protein [Candidatus Freyarchaeota archaeon]|nr:Zn-ribbon domain-containing OB-fold protein [Candidatus Freyarchaeota archaeon]